MWASTGLCGRAWGLSRRWCIWCVTLFRVMFPRAGLLHKSRMSFVLFGTAMQCISLLLKAGFLCVHNIGVLLLC